MLATILAMLVGVLPYDPVARDRCDLIELNHCYSEDGHPVFNQVIFWEWDRDRFRVKAYRVLCGQPTVVRKERGVEFRFCKDGIMRHVTAPSFRETWTQYDPELEDREVWDQTRRTELAYP